MHLRCSLRTVLRKMGLILSSALRQLNRNAGCWQAEAEGPNGFPQSISLHRNAFARLEVFLRGILRRAVFCALTPRGEKSSLELFDLVGGIDRRHNLREE